MLPASCHIRDRMPGGRQQAAVLVKHPGARARCSDIDADERLAALPPRVRSDASLPARIAAIHEHDAAGHQARGVGGQEQDDGGDLSTSPIRAIGVPPIQASYIFGLLLTNALSGVSI